LKDWKKIGENWSIAKKSANQNCCATTRKDFSELSLRSLRHIKTTKIRHVKVVCKKAGAKIQEVTNRVSLNKSENSDFQLD